MGVFDLLKPKRDEVKETKAALDAARHQRPNDGAIAKLVDMLLDTGLDGLGPIGSAQEVAADALADENGDAAGAVNAVARRTLATGAAGGFLTGLGGFVLMPVSLPVNVAEFYIQAVRMVGAIAHLRGYDLSDERVRTAVLLTLVGSDTDEVLRKAGMTSATGGVTRVALRRLPPAALMVVNKAVGFHLMRGVSQRMLSRLGRAVPVAGGFLGGGIDAYMMKKIGDQAMKEFPPTS